MNPEHVALLKEGVQKWNTWKARGEDTTNSPDLSGADLSGANLTVVNLSGADLSRAILTDADLSGANLSNANLSFASLRGAILTRADLRQVMLFGANLSEATLASANLYRATLTEADLSGAYLKGADVSFANLRGAILTFANLISANLTAADLRNAQLTGADLTGADLRVANVSGAILSGANLHHASLSDTVLHETVIAGVDLSQTLGLDACVHAGPSVLDHRTLLKSGTSLPEAFLRGCGLPDGLIAFLPSLVAASAIHFHSCFISYATANQDFADRLYADLQTNGVRCWFAPHDMQGGKRIYDQIDEGIRVSDRLLLLLSSESMASSWVKTEVGKARQKERAQKHTVLFPVGLAPFAEIRAWQQFDADVGEDVAKAIREFYVPDFSTWKTDRKAYQQEFTRLLAALKSTN